jgi:hypothetical protein
MKRMRKRDWNMKRMRKRDWNMRRMRDKDYIMKNKLDCIKRHKSNKRKIKDWHKKNKKRRLNKSD